MAMQGLQQRHRTGCTGKGRCECPWRASVFSPLDGRQIKKTFPSRAAALAWREDSRRAIRRRELRAPTGETLKEASDAFQRAASEGVARPRGGAPYKPATLRSFDQHLRLRVLPALGARKLTSIDRLTLQDFVDRLLADGTSPALIEATCTPLRAILARAVERNVITINPALGLRIPTDRKRRERIAPPQECRALLDALRDSDRALWATALYAGLRRGGDSRSGIVGPILRARRDQERQGSARADRGRAALLSRRAPARARLARGARVRAHRDAGVSAD
jgi:hypothetical protein